MQIWARRIRELRSDQRIGKGFDRNDKGRNSEEIRAVSS